MKNFLFSSLLFLSIHNISFAQEIVALWEDQNIPNYQPSNEKEEIPERNITFIMKVQTPTLEVYLPSQQNANGKGILILPGGGYAGVAYDWEGTDYAKWLNAQGIAAFVLKYRMPQAASVKTSYLAPIQDAQRAMRFIRKNATQYHIEKEQVGVIGSSAGGHLASTLGTHSQAYYPSTDDIDKEDFKPNFMMLIYPVVSMKKGVTHMGSRNALLGKTPSEDLIHQFSNELQVTENTPPTFIVHSGDDGAVPVQNSILIYQALVKNKVKAYMHLFPTGGHGYSMGKSNANAPDWTDLAEDFLN